jgi:hypothetical protein
MSLSRRFFLKSGTLTALAAVLVNKTGSLVFGQSRNAKSSGNFPIPQSAQADMLYYSGYDMFAPYVNSIFTARGAMGEVVQLTLTSVTRYTPSASTRISTGSAPTTQTCSLMFSASGKLPAFSTIPTLNHPALGKLQMFLVYHGEGDSGYIYEAVINHLDGANIVTPIDAPPKKKKSQEPFVTSPKTTPVTAPPVSKPPISKPTRKPGLNSQ